MPLGDGQGQNVGLRDLQYLYFFSEGGGSVFFATGDIVFHKLALNDLFNILLYKIDRGIFCCTENILMYV